MLASALSVAIVIGNALSYQADVDAREACYSKARASFVVAVSYEHGKCFTVEEDTDGETRVYESPYAGHNADVGQILCDAIASDVKADWSRYSRFSGQCTIAKDGELDLYAVEDIERADYGY